MLTFLSVSQQKKETRVALRMLSLVSFANLYVNMLKTPCRKRVEW